MIKGVIKMSWMDWAYIGLIAIGSIGFLIFILTSPRLFTDSSKEGIGVLILFIGTIVFVGFAVTGVLGIADVI